jgi:hypothetical protein
MVSCKTSPNYNLFFVLLLVLILFASPVIASGSVSFADPDATVHRDVLIYFAGNGTLYGTTNTTSNGVALPDEDVMFIMKPQYSNPLDEPGTFLTNAVGWFQTNALSLLILAAMVGFVFKRW